MIVEKSIFLNQALSNLWGVKSWFFHDSELTVNTYISPQTLLCGKIISKYITYSILQEIGV